MIEPEDLAKGFMMFKKYFVFISNVFLFVLLFENFGFAAGKRAESENNVKRIGGNYSVKSIKNTDDGGFIVEFESTVKSSSFNILRLESDHMHIGVEVGQKLRLSAEVLSVKDDTAEVSQVLLFLPNPAGPLPVWLLSRKNDSASLNGAKYIEMHAPQSDFQVF